MTESTANGEERRAERTPTGPSGVTVWASRWLHPKPTIKQNNHPRDNFTPASVLDMYPWGFPFSKGGYLHGFKTVWASLVAQMVKSLPATRETQVQHPGLEDPLEKGMATHSSILTWRIPCSKEPGRLQGHQVAKCQTWLAIKTFTFMASWE